MAVLFILVLLLSFCLGFLASEIKTLVFWGKEMKPLEEFYESLKKYSDRLDVRAANLTVLANDLCQTYDKYEDLITELNKVVSEVNS